MQSPIVNEQERHVLQALLNKGPMKSEQLTELCKNAFGWSKTVIRRTQKSLLTQGLVTVQDGFLIPAVTKESLEDSNWNQLVGGTFEWQSPVRVAHKTQPFFKSIWFWSTCVACVAIVALCIMLLIGPPSPDTVIPDQLQICKEALDKWQENESYHILLTTEILSSEHNIQLPNPFTAYYFHEDDWMLFCWDTANLNSTTLPNYLYRDGQLYGSNNAINPQWQPLGMNITTPKPWPMVFSWENCELDYWNTTTGKNEQYVCFRIIDHSSDVTGVYEIKFVMDNSQNLTKIEAITIQNDRIVRRDTYHLQDTTPEEIAQLISEAEISKHDIGIEEPIPEPG